VIRGHGGNIRAAARKLGCRVSEILDVSSNLNPLGPVPGLMDYLAERLPDALFLPEPDAGSSTRSMARWMDVSSQTLVMGNGTTHFIYAMPWALGWKKALVVAPTYSDYADACRLNGTRVAFHTLESSSGFVPCLEQIARQAEACDAVFFCNPNNPTGVFTGPDELAALAGSCPRTLFVIDESYLPFVGPERDLSLVRRGLPNTLVLISLSKMYCLAGLRAGFCHGPPLLMERIRACCPPWSVNALAQAATRFLAGNQEAARAHREVSRLFCEREKQRFFNGFGESRDVRFVPGAANFLLAGLRGLNADALYEHLLCQKVLIRDCSNFKGLSPAWFRLSLRGEKDNTRVARLLARWLRKG